MNIKIGRLSVDTAKPCDVVEALENVRISIAAGGMRKVVWFGDDKVEYSGANLSELKVLIGEFQTKCAVAEGARPARRRWAAKIRF